MTAPAPSSAPDGLGARTWEAAEDPGPTATPRSQVAVAALVCFALLLVSGLAEAIGWGIAYSLALVAAIAIGLAAPPIPLLRRFSGLVLAILVGGLALVGIMLLWSVGGVLVPPGVAPGLALAALGLDWRRADRLRPVVTLTGAPVLLVALSEEPWAIAAAVVWLAAAFATYTLLEGDRRASLPRVQPDARTAAQASRPDDLLTTLLIAAAVAMLAALVLGVPSCQQRLRGPDVPSPGSGSGSGSTSGGPGGVGSGGPGAPGGDYVLDPGGQFLLPSDQGGGSGSVAIPSPEDVPPDLQVGEPQARGTYDGGEITYELQEDGDTEVTVTERDGTTTEWRFHPRSDGLIEIDRLEPDGSVAERWWYDPDGELVEGTPDQDGQAPPPEVDADDERERPDLATIGRVLGALVLLGLLGWLGWWWWRRRHLDDGEPGVAGAPPWALVLAARLEAAGAERGRPRGRDQTIVRYGQALAEGPLPDGRLPVVAEVVSDAIFSGVDPGPTVAAWAQSTFDEVVEAHPVPSRRDRRHGAAAPAEV